MEKDNVGRVFTIPFLLTTTDVMHQIRNYPFKIFPNNSFLPGEGMKYDTETILEALHNCIAHQDYSQNARIIVIERENELEFRNKGCFYDGTYEDYITGERIPDKYRNPFLAQAMANIKMIDTEGFGIHKMFVSQKERYLPMPDYDKSDGENVVLTIPGNVIDENYSLLLLEHADIDLTTAVLMMSIMGKLVSNHRQRVIYACAILIAANLGGAFTVIGVAMIVVAAIMLITRRRPAAARSGAQGRPNLKRGGR